MNKKIILMLIILFLVSTLGCMGKEINGTYISEKNENDFLRLNENGIYTLEEGSYCFVGNYDFDEDFVYVSSVLGGIKIERNTSKILVDNDGDRWIKK